ncbi:MAG: anion permease, partial [Rhodobacterales bacterium]|nr:anion permease [Rhodobacterales bacterium]
RAVGGAAPAPQVSAAARTRVAAILLVTLMLWMTGSLHGISSAWIGLITASVLLLPGVGVVSQPAFRQSVDFGMLLFVAGALALGAVVNASGLGAMLGGVLERALPLAPGAAAVNFLSLSFMSAVTGLFTTVPGVPAVLTPMAPELAAQTGFDLRAVLMTQVVGFSTVVFPYQVGLLVVAMQMSGERLGHLVRVSLPLAGITLFALMPLDFLWWRLLGWI